MRTLYKIKLTYSAEIVGFAAGETLDEAVTKLRDRRETEGVPEGLKCSFSSEIVEMGGSAMKEQP